MRRSLAFGRGSQSCSVISTPIAKNAHSGSRIWMLSAFQKYQVRLSREKRGGEA